MISAMRTYIRVIDRINYVIGRVIMYGLLVMAGILYWGIITDIDFLFTTPANWTVEMSQYTLATYYLVGGAYSIQLGANIRMDLFYGTWTPRTKSLFDAITILFLIFFLAVLLYGGIESALYSYPNHKAPTLWRPLWWPIKTVMSFGVFLMLLQAFSEFFKDVLRLRGELPFEGPPEDKSARNSQPQGETS